MAELWVNVWNEQYTLHVENRAENRNDEKSDSDNDIDAISDADSPRSEEEERPQDDESFIWAVKKTASHVFHLDMNMHFKIVEHDTVEEQSEEMKDDQIKDLYMRAQHKVL